MLKRIALALAIIVAAVLGYAATRPDTFVVERSTTIAAPAGAIHPHIDDFHRWRHWSPWEKLDPNLARSYGGSTHGVGATYAWRGDDSVGSGRMEITGSAAGRVTIELEFLAPMRASNTVDFTLVPADGGTKVTWTMRGAQPFMNKLISLVVDVDGIVGGDFERGLADLRSVVEAGT